MIGAGRGPQSGWLQIYDISNPAAPVKVTAYKTPGRAARVAVQGSLAFVADGAEGLQVVDLSDPARPSLAHSYKTAGPARDVAVADSLVFVVVGEPGHVLGDEVAGVVILRRNR